MHIYRIQIYACIQKKKEKLKLDEQKKFLNIYNNNIEFKESEYLGGGSARFYAGLPFEYL